MLWNAWETNPLVRQKKRVFHGPVMAQWLILWATDQKVGLDHNPNPNPEHPATPGVLHHG